MDCMGLEGVVGTGAGALLSLGGVDASIGMARFLLGEVGSCAVASAALLGDGAVKVACDVCVVSDCRFASAGIVGVEAGGREAGIGAGVGDAGDTGGRGAVEAPPLSFGVLSDMISRGIL